MISVIIPCRNEKEFIGECIKAIFASTWPAEALEVLVIDGLSDDGSRELLSELQTMYSNLYVYDNPLQITPVAFNLGIQKSKGAYLLIVGARQFIAPNYLEVCYQTIKEFPRVKCVGGKTNHIFINGKSKWIAKAMTSPFGVGIGNFRTLTQIRVVDTVGTPFYPKDIFSEIGLFDENLVRNQDDEFNFRLRKKGYQILFTPHTYLNYVVRSHFKHLFMQYFQYGYWKVYVNVKHRQLTTFRQLVPAIFLISICLGFLLLCFWPWLWPIYVSIWVFYLFFGSWSAFQASHTLNGVLCMLFAFLTLHIAYGLGYLQGFWHFGILHKEPQSKHKKITR